MTQPNSYRKMRKQIRVLRNLAGHLDPKEAAHLYIVINELERKCTNIENKLEQK